MGEIDPELETRDFDQKRGGFWYVVSFGGGVWLRSQSQDPLNFGTKLLFILLESMGDLFGGERVIILEGKGVEYNGIDCEVLI
jgi:hypothetical protein